MKFHITAAENDSSCTSTTTSPNSKPITKNAKKIPTVTLSNGVQMPQYASGTAYRSGWLFRPDLAYRAIQHTLNAGINHIDTASSTDPKNQSDPSSAPPSHPDRINARTSSSRPRYSTHNFQVYYLREIRCISIQ